MARQVTLRLSSVEQLFMSRNRKVASQSSRQYHELPFFLASTVLRAFLYLTLAAFFFPYQ